MGSRLPYTHSGSETGPTCFTADAASASGQQPAGMIRKDHATHFWSLRPGPGAVLRPLLGPPPARLRCPHFMDETESRGRFGQAPRVKRQWVPTCTIHFSPWTEQLKLSSSRARWRLTRAPRLGCQPPLGSSRWKNNCGVGPGLLAGPRAPSPCTRGAKQPAGEPWGGPGWGWGTGHFLRIQGGQGAPSQMWGGEGVSRLAWQRPLPAHLLQPGGADQNTNAVLPEDPLPACRPCSGADAGDADSLIPTPLLPGREAERPGCSLHPGKPPVEGPGNPGSQR